MGYPASFLRLTLRWQLPGGEVANTTCSWRSSSPLVSLDPSLAALLSGKADSFWTAVKLQYASQTFYVGSSVSWISPTGVTLARIDAPVAPDAGSGPNNACPNEVACVVSLRTAVAGRRTRGRMYLPPFSTVTLTNQARWLPSVTGAIATAAATMLGSFTSGAETFDAVVASATGSLLTPVIATAVGDVPDAQRRRRDALIESYATHAVT